MTRSANLAAFGTNALSTKPLTAGTMQSASGSSVDFTNIPSWVNRITIFASDLTWAAASGGSRLRVGSGSLVSTGYTTGGYYNATYAALTDGLGAFSTSSTVMASGTATLLHLGNNTWVSSGITSRHSDSGMYYFSGRIVLAGVLDRISLVATTSTFVSGSVNILYE